jgi:hypothetical protein
VFFFFGEVCGDPLLLLPGLPLRVLAEWSGSGATPPGHGKGPRRRPSRPATNAGKLRAGQPDAPGTIAATSAAHLQRLCSFAWKD